MSDKKQKNTSEEKKIFSPLHRFLFQKKDKRKLKALVTCHGFDMFIMLVILLDALILGLLSSPYSADFGEQELFILDRLFMGIFIVEMIMKIYALGKKFFKSGWNNFDLIIIAVSAIPYAGSFIVLRIFRIFRMFKFIQRWKVLGDIIDSFIILIPAMLGLAFASVIFFYAFSVIGVNLYGDIFTEYTTVLSSFYMTLETFSIDGWMTSIAKQVMTIYPNAWIFYGAQSIIAFMLAVSFMATAVAETIRVIQSKK